MKQITDTRTTPPGGWKYREPSTGVSFEHLSYTALIGEIRKHRAAMDLPVEGDWTAEVQQILIELNPLIPHKEAGEQKGKITADDIHRFILVVKEMLKGRELVSEEEQRRRASICAICPKRGVVGCKMCGWIAREITSMMGHRSIPQPDKIFKHSCLACKCDLTAKTATPLDILKTVDQQMGTAPDYWERCWMREG